MDRLKIDTKFLIHPLSKETKGAFLVHMDNIDYEHDPDDMKELRTYMMTEIEGESLFRSYFFMGYYDKPRIDRILDCVLGKSLVKNDSFDAILDHIIENGPNGEIDGQYVDWNDIRASLVRCGIIKE
jgi:hypothetical protein